MLNPLNGGGYREEIRVNHWTQDEYFRQDNGAGLGDRLNRANNGALNALGGCSNFFASLREILSGRESTSIATETEDGMIEEITITTIKPWNVRLNELSSFVSDKLGIDYHRHDVAFEDEVLDPGGDVEVFELPRDGRYPGDMMRA